MAGIPSEQMPDEELVQVYECGNAALVPLIESVLEGAGIEFMTTGEGLQDLFGGGRFGANFNVAIGGVRFFVRSGDTENARELLADLEKESES